ncbi:MAG: beta strand repeat-containing protein [Saprospiraceae bacterium]
MHQDPTISITGATTICAGGTATLNATVSGGTGTCTIEWQSSPDGNTWTAISNSNNATYTTPALTATTQYRARYSCDGTDCDPVTSNTQTITVQPDPDVDVAGGGVTICSGGAITLTATVSNGTGTPTYQWQKSENGGASWTNVGTNSNTYTTDALTATTQYKVLISLNGVGCDGTESDPVTVTVVPDPDISIVGETTICTGGQADLTATVSGGTGTCTIQWQYLAGATWTNLTGQNNATLNTGTLTESTVYRAIYSCTGLQCDAKVSNTQQITVVNDPSVGISGGAVTICSSGSVTLTADVTSGAGTVGYQWESSLNGTTFSPIAGATNQTYDATNLTATTYYRVYVTFAASGCDAVYSGVSTINVVPDPDVSITGATPVCEGGNMDLTAVTGGGTGTCTLQWQRQLGNGTWVDIAGATNANFNTGALTTTTNYRVRYFCTGGGCDAVFSEPVTVTVNQDPTITQDPEGLVICQGGTHTMSVQSTGGTPTALYQWQINLSGTWTNVANNTPAGATYTGATTADLTVAGITAIGSYEYRAVVSASGSSCEPDASEPATVQVVQDPTIDAQPVGGTICVSGSHTMTVTASGGTPILFYQWEYNNGGTWDAVADGTPAGATYTGGDAASMTVDGITAVGNHQYRVVISATGSDCGTVVSETKTVTVEPALVVDVQPTGSQICVDGEHTMSATISGGSNLTYQWQYNNGGTWANVVNNTPAGATYTGGTTNSLTAAGFDAAGSYQYRLVTTSQGNNCGNIVTQTATIDVANPLAITAQPQGSSICDGGSHTMSVTVTGGNTLTYVWQINNGGTWQTVANGFPTGATYTGASTASVTVAGISAIGSYQYRVITSSTGNNCGNIVSDAATLQVSPSLAITTQPTDLAICVDGTHTMTVAISGGNNVTYQWQYNNGGTWANVTNSTPAGANYTGGTTASLTATGFDAPGTYQYRVVATSEGNNCGNIVSNTATVTVVLDPVVTTQPVGDTICVAGTAAGTSFSVVATGGTPTLLYQWEMFDNGLWIPVTNGTPTATTYTGATTASLGISGTTAVGAYQYRVRLSATGSDCNTTVSQAVTLKVAEDPAITTQPISAVICRGGEHTMNIAATGGSPALNYQWQYNNGGTWENVADNTPAGADYTSSTPYTLQVVGMTAVGTHQYRVVVTASGNGCNPAISDVATITVNEEAEASIAGGGQTVCDGGTADLVATVTGGTGTPSYQWQMKPASGAWTNLSGANSLNLTTPALTETSEFRIVVTFSGSGCDAYTSTAVTINVVPDPVITISGVSDVCVGGGVLISSNVTGGTGTCVIQWQISTDNGSTFSDIVPPATGPTYQTPALSNNTQYRARIVCSGNGCCD